VSIWWALKRALRDYKFVNKHHSVSDVCLPLPKGVLERYRSFCVARNPYDRAVSMWLFDRKKWGVSFKKFLTNIENGEYAKKPKEYSQRSGLGWPWVHIPQTYWITDASGEIIVDKIIRFENLINDMDQLCKEWKLPKLRITKTNTSEQRSGEKRMHWKHYYDKECLCIVSKHFKKDFETFGYKLKM